MLAVSLVYESVASQNASTALLTRTNLLVCMAGSGAGQPIQRLAADVRGEGGESAGTAAGPGGCQRNVQTTGNALPDRLLCLLYDTKYTNNR